MGVTEEEADREILAFYNEFKGLKGPNGLRIIYRPNQESFYGEKGSVESLGFTIKGAFLPRSRELHLPLANFCDAGDLRQTLQHEALGHYGSLTFTDPEKRRLLEVIVEGRQSPSMAADWAKIDGLYAGESDSMKAEEVLCLAAERVGGQAAKSPAQVNRTWREVVIDKKRPMEAEDLQTIVDGVADGIRRETRRQQIFPANNGAQFKVSDELASAGIEAVAQLGEGVRIYPAEPGEGRYKGPLVGETQHHLVQRVSFKSAVAHDKKAFQRLPAIDAKAAVEIRYSNGVAVASPGRGAAIVAPKSKELGR